MVVTNSHQYLTLSLLLNLYLFHPLPPPSRLLVQSVWLIPSRVVYYILRGLLTPFTSEEHTDSLKMGTKVKGFFKGLKNISNIFDEGQEPEIQIGMPTDVKHVAHIGADGPATESPSWMNKFDGGQSQSGPLDMASGQSPDIKKGSSAGTNNHRVSRSEEITRDLPDKPKTSRHRRRSMDNSEDPDSQQKKRTRRRHRLRRSREKGDESSDTKLPDIPKRSRRKKSKEDDGSTKSRDSESSNNEPHLDL